MSEAFHLYGVIGNGMELDFGPIGLDGHRVSAVRHRNLSALVSPSPVRAYKAMKREEVIRYLFAHQAVIEQVMTRHTVIPVKFGTTARDETEVRRILEKGYPQLRAALEAMEGKIELDVVALWRELDSILREIGGEEEIGRLKAAVAARPPGENIEERIQIGKLVKGRLDQRREALGAEIVEALKPLARDLCPHALLDDRMILNTAFLVDRAKEGEVGETLKRLDYRYRDTIDFRCVGPLPPYSFAIVEVRTFEFETIDRARQLLGLQEDARAAEIRNEYRRLVRQCHPDHAYRQAGKIGEQPVPACLKPGADRPFEAVTEAYRLLDEYCEVGSSFRAPDVREAVAVRLLQWSRESGGA